MDWGLKNRISQIIKPTTGRTVMVAVDHGYFLGPTTKLENARQTIASLMPYADTLMLTRGILRTSVDATANIPIVLRVSGGTSILGKLSNEIITTSIKEAIRLNVAGMALSIFIGSEHEKETLSNLCNLVNEAEEYGIPVLAVTAVGKEMARDARYLSLCCRIAAELGAHIVKTYYCEGFEEVAGGCPVPIVVAGGKKIAEKEALKLTYDSIKHGAVGVDMGRNIWQSDYPVAMIQAVREIVHKNASVEEAYKLFKKLSANK